MLDDDGRRLGRAELRNAFESRIRVVEVVVGKRLALDLARGRNARAKLAGAIECGVLVRVLAIAQRFREHAAERPERRLVVLGLGEEPVGDGRVVRGGSRESLGREAAPELGGGGAVELLQVGQQLAVVRHVHDDGDVAVILGGGTDHGRPADVDGLDGTRRNCLHGPPSPRTDTG